VVYFFFNEPAGGNNSALRVKYKGKNIKMIKEEKNAI
jgi:hypothetical protein